MYIRLISYKSSHMYCQTPAAIVDGKLFHSGIVLGRNEFQ